MLRSNWCWQGWLYGSWQGLAGVPTKLPGYLLLEDAPWIPAFGIRYTLGLDGISLLMVMLTAFTFCVALAGVVERHQGKDRSCS